MNKNEADYQVEGTYELKNKNPNPKQSLWTNDTINPTDLWHFIVSVAGFRYGYKFPNDYLLYLRESANNFAKSAILRDLCLNLGIIL